MTGNEEQILAEYDERLIANTAFAAKLTQLIQEVIAAEGVRKPFITSRVKDRASLAKKLVRKENKYSSLGDVTDVCGIRIISPYNDDVERIAKVLERCFDVDLLNSTDKRRALGADQFGYISLHYVISCTSERLRLPEYAQFKGMRAEIQVRSTLQHAWAEIEHDIGYKSTVEVPYSLRRSFSRLAGLLEIADDEFVKIRQEAESYARKITAEPTEKFQLNEVNNNSLLVYLKRSAELERVDKAIAEALKLRLTRGISRDRVGFLVGTLHHLGIRTIGELEYAVNAHGATAVNLAVRFIDRNDNRGSIGQFISVYYVCLVLLGMRSEDEIAAYFDEFFPEETRTENIADARRLSSLARELSQ